MQSHQPKQRIAWALTGSGHYLRECIAVLNTLPDVDLFLSKAAAEILKQYGFEHNVARVFQDKTASSVPVEFFYQGAYHTVIIAPATSNTVAKMVCGISDTLVTNVYAQAGKCGVPSIVFACDTEPKPELGHLESEAPRENMVKVYPRRIDLENAAKLATFEATTVVDSVESLQAAIEARLKQIDSLTPTPLPLAVEGLKQTLSANSIPKSEGLKQTLARKRERVRDSAGEGE